MNTSINLLKFYFLYSYIGKIGCFGCKLRKASNRKRFDNNRKKLSVVIGCKNGSWEAEKPVVARLFLTTELQPSSVVGKKGIFM